MTPASKMTINIIFITLNGSPKNKKSNNVTHVVPRPTNTAYVVPPGRTFEASTNK